MTGTSGPVRVSTKLRRVAELARQAPEMVFTTLAHHVDLEFLEEAVPGRPDILPPLLY